MKKILKFVTVILIVASMTLNCFAAVGTQVNAKELFVAPKAERVFYDILDGVVSGLVKGIAALMPTPAPWRESGSPDGFMAGTKEFLTEPAEDAAWHLGYDSRSILPKNKDEVIGRYYIAGTIDVKGKLATAVEDDLKVRTVAISDGADRETAIFCTIDAYGLALSDVREIRTRLSQWSEENGISSITVSVLHQHSAVDTFGMNGNIWQMALLNPLFTAFGAETSNGKNPEFMENLFNKC